MKITFEELRRIKHALPPGGIHRIADELNLDEQTIRNYFGAHKYKEGEAPEWHLEPGPGGGIVYLENTAILDLALEILNEHKTSTNQSDIQSKDEQIVYIEEPAALYSVQDERIDMTNKKPRSARKTMQLDIFEQMEVLRVKLRNISIPPNVDMSQLLNEVNNP